MDRQREEIDRLHTVNNAIQHTFARPMRWMPTYSQDPTAVLPSLQSCSVNLDGDCDFVTKQKHREYLEAWRHPAPVHCKPLGGGGGERPIYGDRLGLSGGRDCHYEGDVL